MTQLPPEYQPFAALLDTLPAPDRELFHYCLCLLMVEAGKMTLKETIPSDNAPLCIFESSVGELFLIPKPTLSPTLEGQLKMMILELWTEVDKAHREE